MPFRLKTYAVDAERLASIATWLPTDMRGPLAGEAAAAAAAEAEASPADHLQLRGRHVFSHVFRTPQVRAALALWP